MNTKTTSWREVRAKRAVDEGAVAEHVARMEAEERAYRLREIREEQGVTQKELAERLSLTQPTISALESGDLGRSGLATLRSYVEALGGTIEVTATFGTRKLVLSSDASAHHVAPESDRGVDPRHFVAQEPAGVVVAGGHGGFGYESRAASARSSGAGRPGSYAG